MRILFLSHRIPYPPNKGDKIRSYHQLRYLLERGQVYLGALIDDRRDLKYVEDLKRFCADTSFIAIDTKKKKLVSAMRQLTGCGPASVYYFHESALQKWVNALLEAEKIDLVFCFSSTMAEYLFRSPAWNRLKQKGVRLLMDFCDVDSRKWYDYSTINKWPLSTFFKREGMLLQKYEQQIADSFDACFLVSSREKRLFHGIHETDNVSVLQNGVDLDFFSGATCSSALPGNERPVLVFTGAMDYDVNIDGVLWFVAEAWKQIKETKRETELYIVGSNPVKEIQALALDSSITVTGYVKDIRKYYNMATVCIAPLRIARGIQNKVLEAMAMKKPVVCTSNAFEGILATPEKELMVADTPAGFASRVILLLDNREKREELAENARLCVEKKYSWEAQLAQLDQYV